MMIIWKINSQSLLMNRMNDLIKYFALEIGALTVSSEHFIT